MSIRSRKLAKKIGNDFDRILLEVIDNSLTQIGRSIGPVIYHHLEKDFIKKEDIPRKTERFTLCLKQIFGEGEHHIKMVIVENLYIAVGEALEEIELWSFTDYVEDARKKYGKKIDGKT